MTQASKAGHLASYQDLADTPLGPFGEWPQSLRTAVATMMASGHAMCLVWGPERVFLKDAKARAARFLLLLAGKR